MTRIEDLETPAIVVDLDIVERNLRSLAAYVREHGLNLRPHTKTHKVPAIAKMQIESGCSGVTVAKTGEAEVMAQAGLDDILVHYPVYGVEKAARLAALARSRRVTVAVDSMVTARQLSAAAVAAGATIRLLVEADVGMRRCGVAPKDTGALAKAVSVLPGIHFQGLTFYPGHIWAPPSEQAPALRQVSEQVDIAVASIEAEGLKCETVSGGSTPTAYNSHLVDRLTEMRPGTYVFNDRNTIGVGACTVDDCALRVMVTVVSTAVPGRVVVDGGTKTFAADRWLSGEKTGFGLIPAYPDMRVEGLSEEHGHLDVSESAKRLTIGDKLTIVPNHVCACVNMHQQIWFHRGGVVEGSWNVAGRGLVR